jgi:2-octaprenyl-6-methoxyphenol hydroxylase
MTMQRYDVVISGASLTGLASALAVRAASGGALKVVVLDRPGALAPQSDPRAFALSAASVHLLRAIGVWGAIEAEAQPVSRISITGSRLESPARQSLLDYDNQTESGESASQIVPAAHVRDVLIGAFQSSGVPLLEGPPVAGIATSSGDIRIERSGEPDTFASVAVAADGRRSPLRDLAGIKLVNWVYPQSAIVTTVTHSEPHNGVATQHFLEAGPFAILPLAGGHRSSLVWTEATAEAARVMQLDDREFLAALEQRFGGILGELALAGPRAAQPLELQLARSLAADRLAVIGDAARTVHPIAGQGFNLGLRDVAALTECLIDTARLGLDIGGPEMLRRFEQWRRFDSVVSAAAMDGLNRLFSNDNPALRIVRETGLGLTDRLPGLKRMFVAEAAGLTGSVPKLLQGELP